MVEVSYAQALGSIAGHSRSSDPESHQPRAGARLGNCQKASSFSPTRCSPSIRDLCTRRCTGWSSRAGSRHVEGHRAWPRGQVLRTDSRGPAATGAGSRKVGAACPRRWNWCFSGRKRASIMRFVRIFRQRARSIVPRRGGGGRTRKRAGLPPGRTARLNTSPPACRSRRRAGLRSAPSAERPSFQRNAATNAASAGSTDFNKDISLRLAHAGQIAWLRRARGGSRWRSASAARSPSTRIAESLHVALAGLSFAGAPREQFPPFISATAIPESARRIFAIGRHPTPFLKDMAYH